jgi:hypothetical protein
MSDHGYPRACSGEFIVLQHAHISVGMLSLTHLSRSSATRMCSSSGTLGSGSPGGTSCTRSGQAEVLFSSHAPISGRSGPIARLYCQCTA